MKLLVALLGLVGVQAAATQAREIAAVDALVEVHIGQDAPGMAVAVLQDGEIVHIKGYGYANLDDETAVDTDSIFDLASVSKQMTGLAAMLSIEEGLFAEDTPLADLLPEFADSETGERPLVMGDLIHHLTGFPDYLNDESLGYDSAMGNAEIIDWLAATPLDHPPGTEFQYSNSGYVTLGSAVAAANDARTLSDVLHQWVWDELGMAQTGLVEPADPEALVTGYRGVQGAFEVNMDVTITEGDGNVYTSIADFALYETALATNQLLSAEATAALFAAYPLDDGSDEDPVYGFGWYVEDWDGETVASHDGSWNGTATGYARNLDTGVSIIVLSNGEDLDTLGLARKIMAAVE